MGRVRPPLTFMDRAYQKKWKLVVWNLNGVFPDLSRYFEIVDVFDYEKADAYLLWTELSPLSEVICKYAKHMNKPVFVMQHGLAYTGLGREYVNSIMTEKRADYYFIWGDRDRENLHKAGWDDEHIIDVGCPLLNSKKEWKPDGESVGFIPIHHHPNYDDYDEHKLVDIRIWNKLRKIKGITPIAKTLADDGMFTKYLGYQFMTSRNTDDQNEHMEQTFNYLSTLSAVVTTYISTLPIFCYAIGLPVIKVNNESDFKDQEGAINITEEELEPTLRKVISGELNTVHDMNNALHKYVRYNENIVEDIKNAMYKAIKERESKNENSYSNCVS